MKQHSLTGTVHWQHHGNNLWMIVGTGGGRFASIIAFVGDFVSDRAIQEMDDALELLDRGAPNAVLGYNYTVVHLDRIHELSGLNDVAELYFNYSREMFFILDIAEFVSITRQLNAVYRTDQPVPIDITLYDAPDTYRRPGTLYDLEDEDG